MKTVQIIIRYLIWILLIVPVATQLWLFMHNTSPGAGDLLHVLLVLAFFVGWVFAPYGILAIINKYTSGWLNQLFLLVATMIVVGSGVFMLLECSRSTDAQTGLVYVFFPGYQIAVILVMVFAMGLGTILVDLFEGRFKRKGY